MSINSSKRVNIFWKFYCVKKMVKLTFSENFKLRQNKKIVQREIVNWLKTWDTHKKNYFINIFIDNNKF